MHRHVASTLAALSAVLLLLLCCGERAAAGTAVIQFNFADLTKSAAPPSPGQAGVVTGLNAVYVQTNANQNNVEVWRRLNGGFLAFDAAVASSGSGNAGAAIDPLGSQGSLALSASGTALFAVNFNSNTVTSFTVAANGAVSRAATVATGSTGPVSLAFDSRRSVLYVLHALSVSVISVDTALSMTLLQNVNVPALTAPAQIGFTPNGNKLVATNKTPAGSVTVWNLNADGTLAGAGTTTAVNRPDGASAVPFSFVFYNNWLVLTRVAGNPDAAAGSSDLAVYDIAADNTLTNLRRLVLMQNATCWIVLAGNVVFTANTASRAIARVTLDSATGTPTLLGALSVPFAPIDLALSSDARYLYALDGNTGSVYWFTVAGSTLAWAGAVTSRSPQLGFNGIAAF